MAGTGILPNNMRFPSPECYTTWWMMTTYSDTSIDRTLNQLLTVTDLDLITEFDFSHNCAPDPVRLWDLHVFLCRDQSLLNLSFLRTLEFWIRLGTSLLLCKDGFTIFKSDWLNKMDYMYILDIESSLVILRQSKAKTKQQQQPPFGDRKTLPQEYM